MRRILCLSLTCILLSLSLVRCTPPPDGEAAASTQQEETSSTLSEDTVSSSAEVPETPVSENTVSSSEQDNVPEPVPDMPWRPALPDEDISDRFPDDSFRRFIVENVLEREAVEPFSIFGRDLEIIEAVTELYMNYDLEELPEHLVENYTGPMAKIRSLEGLVYFKSLEVFFFRNHEVARLDLRKNPELREVTFFLSKLEELTVGDTDKLEELYCYMNRLTELDVTGCPSLELLWCGFNPLTVVDVSQNPNLKSLECGYSPLARLDVSNNPLLESLDCANSRLTELDVSKCPSLKISHALKMSLRPLM